MAKTTVRARKLNEFDETIAKDYDPEGDASASDGESDSDDSQVEDVGTEHYVSVGKSRMRQKEGVSLGRDYRGSRVSRSALEEDSEAEDAEEEDEGASESEIEFDDPEAADLAVDEAQASDSDIDSDNVFVESDAERFNGFTFRGSSQPGAAALKKRKERAAAADFMSPSGEEDQGGVSISDSDENGVASEESEEEDGGEDASADEDDDSADSEEHEDESDGDESDGEHENSDEDKGGRHMPSGKENDGPREGTLSNITDVEKGMAIQKQRKIFDGLLNLRIRLQKALVAANTFPTLEDGSGAESEPYEAAEEAAIKLLNTISSLRDNFPGSSRTGDKRKRAFSASMPSEAIWKCLEEDDLQAVDLRKHRLEKWSRKVQSVSVTAPRGLGQRDRSLVEALGQQLVDAEGRLAKRTRVPRSCAPVQAARKVTEDAQVYDDADFYQLLLKELVDQRTVETWSAQSSALPSVMVTAAKEAKTRKQVDRKASKGRKMRFTVHEKLQNLMAPDDRRRWEQGAIDRLFGTLFGRKMELDEEESSDEGKEEIEEEEGLRLFRSQGQGPGLMD